jgi:membrane associated rhomboid family serine protease
VTLLVIIVLVGFAIYVMEPEERTGAVRAVVRAIQRAQRVVLRKPATPEPFMVALHERTRLPLVTATLVALNVVVFLRMLFGDGSLADSQTLLAWGGNFAPNTTNGEWWRLVTAAFVHTGVLHLLLNMLALFQVGLILERLIGHTAFALVYFSSLIVASITSLYAHPLALNVGASGAVFGVYGLLFASTFWTLVQRSNVTMPLKAFARLGPAAGLFLLYNLLSTSVDTDAELAGLVTGTVGGLVLARGISVRKPSLRLLGSAAAVAAAVLVAAAFPLRGVADVRPEIQRIVAIEDHTTGLYQTAVNQFKLGSIKAEALAQLIDRTIMPELHAAQGRMKAFESEKVPTEHRPLVADANEYLRLRDESWRLRADALRKSNMVTLRKADRTEWESLEALKKIKPVDQKPVDQKPVDQKQ